MTSPRNLTFFLVFSLSFILSAALFGPSASPQGVNTPSPGDLLEVRIDHLDRAGLVELYRLNVDIDGVWGNTARAYMYSDMVERLTGMGFAVTVLPERPGPSKGMRAGYHTFAELTSELQAIAAAHPDICRLYDIGESVQGRALWFMKISDNVDVEEDEPEFKYISTMHGDEPVGMELCLDLINLLADQYGTDPQITNLVNEVEIWIMPLMNPDGYVHGTRYNANGDDLNRSFPDRVTDPHNTTTGRPVEVRHVMNFAFAHSSVLSANFHTGALVVNYPYDSDPNPWAGYSATPDDDLFIEQSLVYSSRNGPMYNSPWFNHGITNGVAWYMIYGGMQDWNYVWMGCNEVTIELSDTKWPSASKLPGLWNDNRDAMLAYMELCLTGVRGVVTDAATGLPVAAAVRAVGIDHDVYTDPGAGDYHRMLLPGTYDIQVSAAGYKTKVVPGVVVGSGPAARVDVALAPQGTADPVPDIKIDGQDGPIWVSHTKTITMTISLDPGSWGGTSMDWWVFGTKSNTFWWAWPGGWQAGQAVAYAGPLIPLNGFVIARAGIPAGSWTFTFAVDPLNGTYEGTWLDTIDATSY